MEARRHPQIAPANMIELVKQQTLEGFRFQGLFRQQDDRVENPGYQRRRHSCRDAHFRAAAAGPAGSGSGAGPPSPALLRPDGLRAPTVPGPAGPQLRDQDPGSAQQPNGGQQRQSPLGEGQGPGLGNALAGQRRGGIHTVPPGRATGSAAGGSTVPPSDGEKTAPGRRRIQENRQFQGTRAKSRLSFTIRSSHRALRRPRAMRRSSRQTAAAVLPDTASCAER